MNLVPSERGAVRAVNLKVAGGDVVCLSIVCRTPAHAESVYDAMAERLRADRYDFSGIAAATPKDPFVRGAAVRAWFYDCDAGEMAIDATVVRRITDSHVEIRTRMGRVVAVHQRDLRVGDARP